MNDTARDLFFKQKDYYLKGNMEMVKKMAQEAKKKINLANPLTWDEAKKQLDNMSFPDTEFFEFHNRESHPTKKERHNLLTYINKEPLDVMGFEMQAKYNYCPECKEVITKKMTIFNDFDNCCYEKYILQQGRNPNDGEAIKTAYSIFAGILALLIIR